MPSYSLLAIPAMWVTALVPHIHAINVIKAANNGRWDNSNAKGSKWNETLKTTIPAETLARYERAEAAHRNGLESLPLFAAAILAGNHAGLSQFSLNASAVAYLAIRILYNGLYINISKNKTSYARTGVWFVSNLVLLSLFVRAALA